MLPVISVEKSPDFKTIIASGLFGGRRPGFFEAIVYTDEMAAEESLKTPVGDPMKTNIKRTIQCRLYFDPLTAKGISQWLNKQLADYEKDFGNIVIPKEPELTKTLPTTEGTFDQPS